MKSSGFSPYQQKAARFRKRPFVRQEGTFRPRRWLWIALGVIFGLFLLVYLGLGELRFIANHYLGLTFFRKHYVIVLQNNYELRPGGGFITAYGELTTTLGFPTHIAFNNSYAIDAFTEVEAPAVQQKFLGSDWYEGYTFRDANWEPDFPTNAQVLKEFYLEKFPEKEVDGMAVVNFSVVEALVEALGGIEVNGERVEAEELFALITHEVNNVDRHDEVALLNRKAILESLYNELAKKAFWHPFKTRRILEQALEEKELYAWLESNRLQRRLEARGWTNRFQPPEDQDFMALNVANLGSKKADRYLQKEIHHFIDLTQSIPSVRTELTFYLPGGKNQYLDDYRAYVRLYLPPGVQLSENLSESQVLQEEGFTILAHELEFPVGQTRQLVYEYTLPERLWNGEHYDLNLIKQSGSELMTRVTVELSPHLQLVSDHFEARENRGLWWGMLEKDETLSFEVKPDQFAPFPIEQQFLDFNTVLIDWNEPLAEAVARDATNYRIIDRNVANAEVNDEPRVVYAEVQGNQVRLEVDGVTRQDLERYTLIIKNLRDASGNPTNPEQLEVTLVQRLGEEGQGSEAEE